MPINFIKPAACQNSFLLYLIISYYWKKIVHSAVSSSVINLEKEPNSYLLLSGIWKSIPVKFTLDLSYHIHSITWSLWFLKQMHGNAYMALNIGPYLIYA